MTTTNSSNIIPNIHRFIDSYKGENYWFNGAAAYVMDCLGESQYNYGFFAGISGDNFTQVYYGDNYRECNLSALIMGNGDSDFIVRLYEKCGYEAEAVNTKKLNQDVGSYIAKLKSYIDNGVAVAYERPGGVGVFVGYEDDGQTLLYITGDSDEPQKFTLDEALEAKDDGAFYGWVFVGEKKREIPLAEIYREAIQNIPAALTMTHPKFSCGAKAFRDWADEIDGGKYDRMAKEEFNDDNTWWLYANYVCILATNGSAICNTNFLDKALELNPDLTFLNDVKAQYARMGSIWGGERDPDPDCLEAIGGGFNITLEALQDKARRAKITAKIRECADCSDAVVQIISENLS